MPVAVSKWEFFVEPGVRRQWTVWVEYFLLCQ